MQVSAYQAGRVTLLCPDQMAILDEQNLVADFNSLTNYPEDDTTYLLVNGPTVYTLKHFSSGMINLILKI